VPRQCARFLRLDRYNGRRIVATCLSKDAERAHIQTIHGLLSRVQRFGLQCGMRAPRFEAVKLKAPMKNELLDPRSAAAQVVSYRTQAGRGLTTLGDGQSELPSWH
jgi:hypothetical protein